MTQQRMAIITVTFTELEEGRIYVSSPDLPGLHIVSPDRELLRRDIPVAIKDLLHYGHNLTAEVKFVPSLNEILSNFGPSPRLEARSEEPHSAMLMARIEPVEAA